MDLREFIGSQVNFDAALLLPSLSDASDVDHWLSQNDPYERIYVFGSCGSCSSIGPDDIRFQNITARSALIFPNSADDVSESNVKVPPNVGIFCDPDRKAQPEVLYDVAPVVLEIDKDGRIKKVLPIESTIGIEQ